MHSCPPCNNFNCNSTAHESWRCPLPPVCRGCHSNTHLWPQCPEQCINCGAPLHKIDYCYDFAPGTCYKPWNFPKDIPLGWIYYLSYKTNYEAIMNGDNRFGPKGSPGGKLLVPAPMSSGNPKETSQPAWALVSMNGDTGKTGLPVRGRLHNSIQRLRAEANPHSLGKTDGIRPAREQINLPLMPQPYPSKGEKRTRVEDTSSFNTERRRVIVENIPQAATPDDLNWFFSRFNVEYIALAARCAGYAVVGFATAEDADRAIRNLSGKALHGSPISVQLEEHPTNELSASCSNKQQLHQEGSRSKRVKIQEDHSTCAVVQAMKEGPEVIDLDRAADDTVLDVIESDRPLMADGRLIEFHIGNLDCITQLRARDLLKIVKTNFYVCSENMIKRDEILGYYIVVWIERKKTAKAAMNCLSAQSFEGKELKIRQAERLIAGGKSGGSKTAGDLLNSDSVGQREEVEQAATCAIAEQRRVRVENLKADTTYFDLRDYFKDYAVKYLTMCFKPNIPQVHGYKAFVDFATADEARRAIAELDTRQSRGDLVGLNKPKKPNKIILDIEGRKTKKVKNQNRGDKQFLRVTNVPFEANEQDVRNLFDGIEIKSITLPSFANTWCPAGYAIVELSSAEHARFARIHVPKRDFLGGHVAVVMEEEGPDLFAAPIMPDHLRERQDLDLKQKFRETMLCAGDEQKDWNRRILKEWWMAEKGICLDIDCE